MIPLQLNDDAAQNERTSFDESMKIKQATNSDPVAIESGLRQRYIVIRMRYVNRTHC